jgi:hypothetical protein
MTQKASWRIFRRMQDSVLAVGLLVYAAAALDAWRVLPLKPSLKLQLAVVFPGAYLVATLAGVLAIPHFRRAIHSHLWASYRTGFGQSATSVIVGLGLMVAIAGLIVWQVHHLAGGGTSPGGAFSGYGAGLGLLIAQAMLVRTLEKSPAVRAEIGSPGEEIPPPL